MTWPARLTHLSLGFHFNMPLAGVSWPKGLRTLVFGDRFNQVRGGCLFLPTDSFVLASPVMAWAVITPWLATLSQSCHTCVDGRVAGRGVRLLRHGVFELRCVVFRGRVKQTIITPTDGI